MTTTRVFGNVGRRGTIERVRTRRESKIVVSHKEEEEEEEEKKI